jgi:hypothetical protein
MGERDEAISVIERAIALQPDDSYLNEQKARFQAGK